jgi:hypothetical protein
MLDCSRLLPFGIAKLALTLVLVSSTGAIAAPKSVQQCQADHNAAVDRCYANPDTSHMDTPTDVKYCLNRANNKFNNCLSNAVDAVSSALEYDQTSPPKRPRRPEALTNSGLLFQSQGFSPQSPSTTGRATLAPTLR